MSPRSGGECWVDPDTRLSYPTLFGAYRRTREAQERTPPRHCGLGAEIDRYVWRRWQGPAAADVDVVLTFRPGTSPRVQRIVSEVLRAVRRGQTAGEAIRHVARRFGLRDAHARAFITAGIGFEMRARHDSMAHLVAGPRTSNSPFAERI